MKNTSTLFFPVPVNIGSIRKEIGNCLLTLSLVVVSIALLPPPAYSQPALQWARSMGGASTDFGLSLAVDGSGNVYTTGRFNSVSDFDPGAGTYNLTTAGSDDIFISKLDASGNFLWAGNMGGTSADYGYALNLDQGGNVYVAGYFATVADFNPGAGTYNLTSAGNNDIFISKIDAAGSFLWARRMGGTAWEYALSVLADGSGNVLSTGYYNGMADFDPGGGSYNLTTAGSNDIFVSKLSSTGAFVWAKRMGGTGLDQGHSIALDNGGNIYTTGYFYGVADFDPGAGTTNLTSAGANDIFVSKLNASGGFLWAARMGGTADDYAQSVTVDASGNVFIMGDTYSASVDMDPSGAVYNIGNTGTEANFIAQYDNTGNFSCAFSISPGHNETLYDRHIAVSGTTVWATGTFDNSSADFDPCSPVYNAPAYSFPDIFVSRYDMSSCSCTLPVELTSFTGRNEEKKNILQWQTASERNNSHFSVERSGDGAHFKSVGIVPGVGNSTTDMNYEFNDILTDACCLPASPAGGSPDASTYYRLKQVDYDGRYDYSRVIAISVNAAGTFDASGISLSDAGVLAVTVNIPSQLVISFQLFDITGQKVLDKAPGSFNAGTHILQADISRIGKGIHYLVLNASYAKQDVGSHPAETIVRKLVIP